jgi:hypothetical protein
MHAILTWQKYSNFFDLWREHKYDTRLIYVIGESKYCYVGSIGSRGGKQGLSTRYQWQYVERSRAIFGIEEEKGQSAFVGLFVNPKEPSGDHIRAVEARIQNCFILRHSEKSALFHPLRDSEDLLVEHLGSMPSFLRDEKAI